MTTDEMLNALKIDRTSPKSLKSQLEDLLGALIEKLEEGTVLPPERMISETLQVSRVTVRSALNKYYINGMIVRHGRLGTAVAPGKQNVPAQLNPLILGMEHEIMQQPPLRFLVYETLPIQKKFWNKTISDYNSRPGTVPVEIVWLDNFSHRCDIKETILSEKIDILMCSHMFDLDQEINFAKLPSRIKNLENSDSYIFKDHDIDLTYSVPFYLASPVLLWNREIAEGIGISRIPERVNNGELLQLLAESSGKLPENCLSGVRIWDYLYMMAEPDMKNNLNQIYPILEDLVQTGKSVKNNIDKLFVTNQKYTFDNIESFLQKKRLFLLTNISLLQFFDPPDFPHGFLTFPSRKNLSSELLKIAISKNCLNVHAAADFLCYLISPEVQKNCADLRGNFPVHKELLSEYLQNKYHQTKPMASEFIQNLALPKDEDAVSYCFRDLIVFYLREELKELLHGNLKVDGFIETMESKLESLKYRTLSKRNAI